MSQQKKRSTLQDEDDMEDMNNNNNNEKAKEKKKEEKSKFKHPKEAGGIDEIADDPYEDEFYDEEVIVDPNDLSDEEKNDNNTKNNNNNQPKSKEETKIIKMMHNLEVDPKKEETSVEKIQVWRRDKNKLEPDDELEFDPDAYFMLHRMHVQWPCLSFDVLLDQNGFGRKKFPLNGYFISGSQAEHAKQNKIYIMKATQLHRIPHDNSDEEDEENDDDDDDEIQPELFFSSFDHFGTVNRIRSMGKINFPQNSHIISTWSDQGEVYIFDIKDHLKKVDSDSSSGNSQKSKLSTTPLMSIKHSTEGFAMDWSPLVPGQLLTGDCSGKIKLINPTNSGWTVHSSPFTGHKDSIEDIQWSPTEKTVFSTCSVDQSIKIFDTRMSNYGCSFKASNCDINVISWNSKSTHLLASGNDDGSFKVWDLRSVKKNQNVCDFIGHHQWHDSPITSIEWDPNDDSTLAVSSDDLLTIWDLSLEKEEDISNNNNGDEEEDDYPPQLLFEHMGQKNIKELHWHPQLSGVLASTAEDSINIFKPNIIEN